MERKSPSLKVWPPTRDGLACRNPHARARAADADLAHLPGDERRVRTHAAARGQNAFRRDHAAQIFRRSFDADEQNFLALFRGGNRAVGVEINFAGGRAGTGGQTGGDGLRFLHFGQIKDRREQLVELVGRIAQHRRSPQSISFSFTMSTANLSAAAAVRLPLRVWSMNSLPS